MPQQEGMVRSCVSPLESSEVGCTGLFCETSPLQMESASPPLNLGVENCEAEVVEGPQLTECPRNHKVHLGEWQRVVLYDVE